MGDQATQKMGDGSTPGRFDTGLPRQMQQQEYGDDGPFGGPWLGVVRDKGPGKSRHQ